MAIPIPVSVGAKASGIGAIQVPLPPGLSVNDVLILVTGHSQVGNPLTVPDGGGGTWSPIGGFGGQQSNQGVRGTWFWSRYNGTQTGITLSDTGGMAHARITAYRDCIETGSPIHGESGMQPLFAETLSTLPALPISSNDVLVLDSIVGELPDADGTGIYGPWTNANLTTPAELFDDSSSAGTGGSFAMQAGGMPLSGSTGTTTVSHANFRVVGKKIALTPATIGPVPRVSRNARGQVLIDGVPRFPLLIYDGGLGAFNDQASYLANERPTLRFKNLIDLYLNYQNGTIGNSLRFADALAQYNMYALTTGNALTVYDLSIPPPTGYDVHDNPTYNFAPLGSAPFRTHWAAHPRSFGIYLYDEPSHGPSFSGNGTKTLFTFTARPTVFTPPDFIVKVNGVQQTLNVDFTVQTHAGAFDGEQGPNFSLTFAVPPPSGTFNIPVRYTYVFNSIIYYHGQLRSQMPGQHTFGALLNGDLGQYIDWSHTDLADSLGSDIYVIGQGPESQTGATYGYMNFNVGEVCAMGRYYAAIDNRIGNVILQLNKFGSQSRHMTTSEIRSHCIAALTEFKGTGFIGWWAWGNGNGAIHQEPFGAYYLGSPSSPPSGQNAVDGINRIYNYNAYVLDASDVFCKYTPPAPNNTERLMSPSEYVVNGVGVFSGSPTVTMNVAPAVGSVLVVTARAVGLAMREAWLSTLETLCTMIKQHESIMLTPDNPSLITNNSGWFATPIAWRINLLQLLSQPGPTWLFGLRSLYITELALLQQATPDTSLSNYLLDQRSHVRTAAWEVGATGLVTGYNMHPDPQTVTLTWHANNITRVEVLGEGRDVPVIGGTSWTDTYGGGSALRQGPSHQGHVYRLTLSGVTPPSSFTMTADPGTYTVTGTSAVLTWMEGPKLVGFVWRR